MPLSNERKEINVQHKAAKKEKGPHNNSSSLLLNPFISQSKSEKGTIVGRKTVLRVKKKMDPDNSSMFSKTSSSGFTPPSTKNTRHRKKQPDVILTANVAVSSSPLSFSISPNDRRTRGSTSVQVTASSGNTTGGLMYGETNQCVS